MTLDLCTAIIWFFLLISLIGFFLTFKKEK
jgi:hypothetical protein